MARLSQELQRYFFEEDRGETVSLAQVIALAEEKVFGVVLLLLAFPSALPLPAIGYSVPFGIAIFLVSMQLVIGRKEMWLPLSWQRKTIKTEKVQGILTMGLPWLRKVEAIAHPRFPIMCQTQLGRTIMGLTICLMAISMACPIPGTNTLPAMGVFLIAFGLQEDDGLISATGVIFALLIAVIMVSVIYVFFNGGLSMLDIIKDWVKMRLGAA
jgi:hypothetical protein